VEEGQTTIDPVQATAWFRQRLATLRLQAPTPIPGAPGEGDFLDVLGCGSLDTTKPLASLVTLARAAKPPHVWQVFGTVTTRAEAPCFGVTVHVVRLPSRGNPPETLWGRTLRQAIDRAADHATATILTHTRQCRSPWVRWRRRVLPGELLASYEDAARLESAGRYDEALDAYYRALRLDPFNMVIRLRIGQLQEKLGLYLDAVANYQGTSSTTPAGAGGVTSTCARRPASSASGRCSPRAIAASCCSAATSSPSSGCGG
jgi:hypothetical protein